MEFAIIFQILQTKNINIFLLLKIDRHLKEELGIFKN